MTTTDLATTDKAPARPSHYRISTKVRKGCEALVSGAAKTVTDAAKLANISREELSRALSKPHVAEFLKQKACRALAMAAGRAAAKKVELLEAESEHVQNDASTYLLALAGIKPAADAQVSVNIELKAGYVIDLRDDPPVRTIDAEAS